MFICINYFDSKMDIGRPVYDNRTRFLFKIWRGARVVICKNTDFWGKKFKINWLKIKIKNFDTGMIKI